MFKSNRIYTHFLLTVSHRILHTEAQTARAVRKCKQLLRFCLYEQWVNIDFTLKTAGITSFQHIRTAFHRAIHTEAQTARAARKCKQLLRFCLCGQKG